MGMRTGRGTWPYRKLRVSRRRLPDIWLGVKVFKRARKAEGKRQRFHLSITPVGHESYRWRSAWKTSELFERYILNYEWQRQLLTTEKVLPCDHWVSVGPRNNSLKRL